MKLLHLYIILLIYFQNITLIKSQLLPFCVPKCKCSETSVECMNRKLTTVPIIAAETTNFDLRYNEIKNLNSGAFGHLSLLTNLYETVTINTVQLMNK